jgi:serine/threonine protein kinase
MWSLGVLMYTLIALHSPFTADNILSLAQDICNKTPLPLPNQYSKQLRHMVTSLLNKDPSNRPTIQELIESFPVDIRVQYTKPVDTNSSKYKSAEKLDAKTLGSDFSHDKVIVDSDIIEEEVEEENDNSYSSAKEIKKSPSRYQFSKLSPSFTREHTGIKGEVSVLEVENIWGRKETERELARGSALFAVRNNLSKDEGKVSANVHIDSSPSIVGNLKFRKEEGGGEGSKMGLVVPVVNSSELSISLSLLSCPLPLNCRRVFLNIF